MQKVRFMNGSETFILAFLIFEVKVFSFITKFSTSHFIFLNDLYYLYY